jgi:hypothetical protein
MYILQEIQRLAQRVDFVESTAVPFVSGHLEKQIEAASRKCEAQCAELAQAIADMIRMERDTRTTEGQDLRRAVEELQGAAGLRDSLTSVEDFARQLADLTTSEIARFSAVTKKEKEALLRDVEARCHLMEDLAEQHLRIQSDLNKRQSEAMQQMDQFAGDTLARLKQGTLHFEARSPTRTTHRQVQLPVGVRRFVSDGPRHFTTSPVVAGDGAKISSGGGEPPNLVDGLKVACSEEKRPVGPDGGDLVDAGRKADPGRIADSGRLAEMRPPPDPSPGRRNDSSPGRRAEMSSSPIQRPGNQAFGPGSLRAPIGVGLPEGYLAPRLVIPWRLPTGAQCSQASAAPSGTPPQQQPC